MILRKIYHELVAIRKELQAIRHCLELMEQSKPDSLRSLIESARRLQKETGKPIF